MDISKEKEFLRREFMHFYMGLIKFTVFEKTEAFQLFYKTFQVRFCTAVQKMLQQCWTLQPDLIS